MSGWPIKELGKVCEFKPSKRQARAMLSAESLVSFMPMNELGICHMYPTPAEDRILSEVVGSYTYFADGDVLLAKITPCFENGKLGVARGLTNGVGFGSSEFHVLRPSSEVLAEYVYYFLERAEIRERGAKAMTGAVGHRRVPEEFLERLEIPLPPLEAQRRIVAVLDETFAAIATATANAETNLANARELLHNEIDRELFSIGPDWVSTTLDSVCSRFQYGTSAKSRPAGDVPVLRMGNIQDGEVDWTDLVFTDDEGDVNQLSLMPNDVLFNRTNSLEHVGKAAIVRGNRLAIFAGYLIRLHCIPDAIDPEFLNLYLNSRPVRAHGRAQAGKSVNQANISAGKLRTYPIHLPPLTHQKMIVSKIARLRTCAESLRDTYLAKREALNSLKRSLLEQAFAGDLTTAKSKANPNVANDNFTTPKGSAQIIAFAYWLHKKANRDKSYKHIKAQKCLHNIENIAAIDLGRQPRKFPYGPHDPVHMDRAEDWARENGFFEFVPSTSGPGLDFKKLANYDTLWAETVVAIKPFASAVERAIEPLVPMNGVEAELFATVHAAWNNLIRDGAALSDDAIVREAREDWDQAKTNIPRHRFYDTIKLIKKMRLEPDGTGKYVGGQARLL